MDNETQIESLVSSWRTKRQYAAEAHRPAEKAAWLADAAACLTEARAKLAALRAQLPALEEACNEAYAEWYRLRNNGEWKHALITTAEYRLRMVSHDRDKVARLIERGEAALKKVIY